ncbi:MAG TPA: DUF881 domain-containing protein [Nocardioidaceae bacterium]|nr:DUF881 domain-containing protein [Nocardioidaceae bacterium]
MRETGRDMDDEQATEPEGTPQPSGRTRLLGALRKPGSRGQLTAAVLLAVVGFASVVQVQATGDDDVYAGMRQEDMLQLLNSLSAASERAENEIAQLEQTRSSLRNNTESRQAALQTARQQANVLGILAGTLPAVGPGVVITVEDPTGAVGIDQLLNGLEELRDAGAEAIEINDSVRVVAQTALEGGDGGVVVDGQQLSAPYTIEAIGDSHTLGQSMDISGGFTDQIETVGGEARVKEVNTVEIASTRQPEQSKYAEPVETE